MIWKAFPFLLTCLTVSIDYSTGQTCYCTTATSRPVYGCPDKTVFVTNVYSDDYDVPCILAAKHVATPTDWVAGILENTVSLL